MKSDEQNNKREILRNLPSVDAVLRTAAARRLTLPFGTARVTEAARGAVAALRAEISADGDFGESLPSRAALIGRAENHLETELSKEENLRLRRVINATGVIIHTNLGRAPLSEAARRAIIETAAGYCNLEFDTETGKRGRRGADAERLLADVTGAEAALIVNNCAAAAFLILTVLAAGGEVVMSRGELVEIGGDFRVPDVMAQSGAILREVGTTNRTKISDYENAVGENTRLFMKVHPSNYRIIGFTESVSIAALCEAAARHRVAVYEDAGSGAIFDLSAHGLTDEPLIPHSVRAGADVVSFSGDKLLGGVQSGLIVGRAAAIDKIRRHPLYRALRADKMVYAALAATLEAFRRETHLAEIPVLRMLAATGEEIRMRAENLRRRLHTDSAADGRLSFELTAGNSVVGGGSAPDVQPETTLLAIRHRDLSAAKLEEKMRNSSPPLVARIVEDAVVIDLRTVSESEETEICDILASIR